MITVPPQLQIPLGRTTEAARSLVSTFLHRGEADDLGRASLDFQRAAGEQAAGDEQLVEHDRRAVEVRAIGPADQRPHQVEEPGHFPG